MWAIRRTANFSRRLIHGGGVQNVFLERDILTKNTDCKNQLLKEASVPIGNILCSYELFNSTRSMVWSRNLSSTFGARSNDDLEDGFSDLDDPIADESKDDDVIDEVDGTDDSIIIPSGPQVESNSQVGQMEVLNSSPLFKMFMETTRQFIPASLNQWVREGKPLGKSEVHAVVNTLSWRKMYGKALKFMEWLEESKHIDSTEHEYAVRVDLTAKMFGIQKAEKYIDQIPDPLRTQNVYNALLVNCVNARNIKKSEEIFKEIRRLGPPPSFSCCKLLSLYKRDPKKVSNILELMQKEDVKHTHFTYRILIGIKGSVKDIQGIEEIVKRMNAEGIDLATSTKAMIARYCIQAKQNDKAEGLLKEIERDNINENRDVICTLLHLYALLGKADEVSRIWKVCETNPTVEECSGAIEAWGMLGDIENAENLFNRMSRTWRLSPRYYYNMLKVYADHKLIPKVHDLLKLMIKNKRATCPVTWDLLVKLFVDEGEVEQADYLLSKVLQNVPSGSRMRYRPMYSTYLAILDQYAERGDVRNAEKIFKRMRQDEYVGQLKMYTALLKAYIKARVPAYGFRERMKADCVVPNIQLWRQLAEVDHFAED